MTTDAISDLLTRIRNGQRARHAVVTAPASQFAEQLLNVLQREGYIRGFSRRELRKGVAELEIELKYHERQPVIRELRRISTPGRRVYTAIGKLQKYYNGLGVTVLSTSKGVLSDYEARQQGVGGEVLCAVF